MADKLTVKIKDLILYILRKRKEKELIPIYKTIKKDDCLKNRIALVTGGTSGIGLAIAKSILHNGGKVIIASSTAVKIENALKELNSDSAKGIKLDVTSSEDIIKESICKAEHLFDNKKIDILINCAGITQKCNFFQLTESEYNTIMNINVKGTFFMSKVIGKYFIENGIKGNILNISSSSALKPAWGAYQISKWAIRGFTIGLAEQLTPYGITVNAIAPGKTATPMMGFGNISNIYSSEQASGRYIVPEEIAEIAVTLLSPAGKMIIGDTVYVTGGNGFF